MECTVVSTSQHHHHYLQFSRTSLPLSSYRPTRAFLSAFNKKSKKLFPCLAQKTSALREKSKTLRQNLKVNTDTTWEALIGKAARGGVVMLVAASAFTASLRGWGSSIGMPPLAIATTMTEEDMRYNKTSAELKAEVEELAKAEGKKVVWENVFLDEKEEEILEKWRKDPNNVSYLTIMLFACLKHGDIAKAIMVARNLKHVDPFNFEWRLVLGQLLSKMDQLQLAEEEYQEVLDNDPFNIEALQGLTMVVQRYGDDSAVTLIVEDALRRAERENEKDAIYNLKLLLGNIYIIQEKFDKALEHFQKLIKEDRKDFRPYLCQGIVYNIKGNLDEAEKCFETYKRLIPKDFENADFLNEAILSAQTEARRQIVEKKKNEELIAQGMRPQLPMKKPVSVDDESHLDEETPEATNAGIEVTIPNNSLDEDSVESTDSKI